MKNVIRELRYCLDTVSSEAFDEWMLARLKSEDFDKVLDVMFDVKDLLKLLEEKYEEKNEM